MGVCSDNALVVQSDCSVLLEVHSPHAAKAREAIAPFAELVKSPEHVHTYRLSPLSIWNARAAGLAADEMVAALHEHSRYPVPENVDQTVLDLARRFGRVVITRENGMLRCTCGDEVIAEQGDGGVALGYQLIFIGTWINRWSTMRRRPRPFRSSARPAKSLARCSDASPALSAMEGRSPRRIVPGRRRPHASASDTPSSHCGCSGAPRSGVPLQPQDGRGTHWLPRCRVDFGDMEVPKSFMR
jgi:hypothetical protein